MNTMQRAATPPTSLKMTLPSDTELVMERWFRAPPALVFDAHVNPEHLPHWWGRTGSTLSVCEVELRPGGAYRFVEKQADGDTHAFHGTYREVVPGERLVSTFIYDPLPTHVSLAVATFTAVDGGTLLTDRSHYFTREDRDGMVQAGCDVGAEEAFTRLDARLAAMR